MIDLKENFELIFKHIKQGANILLIGPNNSGKSVVFNIIKDQMIRYVKEKENGEIAVKSVEVQSNTDLLVWKDERLALLFADLGTAYKTQKFLESDFNVCQGMCEDGYLGIVATLYPIGIKDHLNVENWDSKYVQDLLTAYNFSNEFKRFIYARPLLVVLTEAEEKDIVMYIDNLTRKGSVLSDVEL